MRGELLGVWSEAWREIWAKLARHPEYGDDFVSDFFRELVPEPKRPIAPPPPTDLSPDGELVDLKDISARDGYKEAFLAYQEERARYEEAIASRHLSRDALRKALCKAVKTEQGALRALEKAHSLISTYEDEEFENRYFNLFGQFITKYSLRYDLRRPFSLHPTLPGVFARLIHELQVATLNDAALAAMLREFDDSVRDLRDDQSSSKIKTCIHKQMNLLEAIAQRHPGVNAGTLGDMCNQVGTWPHATVREAMKKLYGFASNYPGIRHAGNPGSALREIEMRDMVAMSVLLAGFVPYLSDRLDAAHIYRAGDA